MPLAFETINRGTVAFGFFNIDIDMLLLENCFFYADTFSNTVINMAETNEIDDYQNDIKAYRIDDFRNVGDLMGAIHGINLQGFIGEVYQAFPFPKNPSGFKQQPDGYKNRDVVEPLIQAYATGKSLSLSIKVHPPEVKIDIYQFSWEEFGQLIRYVLAGGAPGWKNNERPPYVIDMMEAISKSGHQLFRSF